MVEPPGQGGMPPADLGKNSPAYPTSNERTIFEQWADQHGYAIERRPAPYTNSENRSGNYRSDLVQAMWDTWEARAAMRQDETADEPPVMGAGGGTAPMPTALDAIEAHVRQIQMLCDATGRDPAEWLCSSEEPNG